MKNIDRKISKKAQLKVLDDCVKKLESTEDPLDKRINEYIKIKGIGNMMMHCADYVMRCYMAQKFQQADQQGMANRTFNEILKPAMDKKGHVDSIIYKIIELGELLECLESKKNCKFAKDCWITRKGFAKCRDNKNRW